VVIGLKRDESHEIVVGQISMYMAWLRENLARQDQDVKGIICVFSSSDKLTLAARNVSGLEVYEYSLNSERSEPESDVHEGRCDKGRTETT
jgi:RecB family endonuclease NucS